MTKAISNYVLNDMIHSFTPSDMNFQTILMPKVILAKSLPQKKGDPLEPFLSLVCFSGHLPPFKM